MNIIVILAGGSSVRYGGEKLKQYSLICGKELIEYVIEEMKKSCKVDKILVVLNDDQDEIRRIGIKYKVEVVVGGKERAYSFQNALDYISDKYPECKKVVFHEAARPLVSYDVIDMYFDYLDEYDYVETCKKITDSLGSYIQKTPRREDYYLIQAPEAYRFSILKQYFDCDSPVYFAANQFPDFVNGYRYFGLENNIKLTTLADKLLIEFMLNHKNGII